MSGGAKLQVRVAEVVEVNELIKRFRFVSRDGAALPAFPVVRILLWKWMTTVHAGSIPIR